MAEINITAAVDTGEVDAAIAKVKRLVDLVDEARSLLDDLASKTLEINLSLNSDD